ncbi:hypothetical protein [Bifidobacterium stellenboschense]|uniref:Uncharacterized protein n=1 Tax=Bifidobacterium stellenboschense TaxID=762211 RepID=A0A087DQN8_9BIFI|nr:hypothetical protein [Bifidobacterium stellenboschense]KFI97838.1 hypothetical protein BSTEL_0649 [Bifidobacterium stellenboschense]
MSSARIYTQADLAEALRHWADHVTLAAIEDTPPEACARYVYEHYGLETDTTFLDEPAHTEPGLCARCGDYDPKLTGGLCPVCQETGGRR